MPPDAARRLLGSDAIIGYSTHTIEQAERGSIAADRLHCFRPHFPDGKRNPDPVGRPANARRVGAVIGDFPLVAIGGIGEPNCRNVLAAGADSAAIISAVLNQPIGSRNKCRSLCWPYLLNIVKNSLAFP